jgi:hypothetical protein
VASGTRNDRTGLGYPNPRRRLGCSPATSTPRLGGGGNGHATRMAQRQNPQARTEDQRRRLIEEMRRLEHGRDETGSSDEPDADAASRETEEPSEGQLRKARRRLDEQDQR